MVIFLGKQELTFHGHQELLANDPSINTGNFLEVLKYQVDYNDVIATISIK